MTTGIHGDMPTDPELILEVTSLVTAFVTNALKTAEIYVNHAERNIILAEDIKLCLRGETFSFLDKDNSEVIDECRETIKKKIRKDLEGTSDTDSDIEYEDDEKEIFIKSKCKCDLCIFLHKVDNEWDSWNPTSPLEILLKKNIDKI